MTVSVPRGDSSRYISNLLPESSPLGAVLAGLFGFRSAPTPLEVLAYFAYLIPVVAIYLYTDRPRQLQRPATA
jgi:high-affinity iron transporter